MIASAQLTNEELFLIRTIFQGALVSASVPERPGSSDEFLVKADKNPNTMGATLLGLCGQDTPDVHHIVDEGIAGHLDIFWVFGHDLVALFGEARIRELADRVGLFIFSGTNENPTVPLAHCVLPSAAYVEKDGTFVNCDGRVQRTGKAFAPLGDSREDWRTLLELARMLDLGFEWDSPEGCLPRPCRSGVGLRGIELPDGRRSRGRHPADHSPGGSRGTVIEDLLIKFALAGFVLFTVLNLAGFHTWVERKQSALIQDRIGANRAPIFGFRMLGLFHGVADAIKMFTKEDIVPARADKVLHTLAPFFSVFFALVAFAAIPFGDRLIVGDRVINLQVAKLDAALLYVFAMLSLGVYGVILAGFASRNNYAILGGLRATAQMILLRDRPGHRRHRRDHGVWHHGLGGAGAGPGTIDRRLDTVVGHRRPARGLRPSF